MMVMDQGALLVSLDECKAYLRIAHDDEDAVLAGLIRTATLLCEAFVGAALIERVASQRLQMLGGVQQIRLGPVRAVEAVRDGVTPLPAETFVAGVDGDGRGWVELLAPDGLQAPEVVFRAGMAADWNEVPEPLRQGVVRMVAHLHAHRDAADAGPPPAAVAALWRPFRRMRLG